MNTPKKPAYLPDGIVKMVKNKDWHSEDIKAAIRKSGETLESLSEAWGFEKSAVSKALNVAWPEVQELIAAHLDTSPITIWPSRYDQYGLPVNYDRSRRQFNAVKADGNVDFRDAA